MLTKMRSYTSDHVRSQYLSSTYKLVSLPAKLLSYSPLDSYKSYFMFFLHSSYFAMSPKSWDSYKSVLNSF